jgi:hypothetical protein
MKVIEGLPIFAGKHPVLKNVPTFARVKRVSDTVSGREDDLSAQKLIRRADRTLRVVILVDQMIEVYRDLRREEALQRAVNNPVLRPWIHRTLIPQWKCICRRLGKSLPVRKLRTRRAQTMRRAFQHLELHARAGTIRECRKVPNDLDKLAQKCAWAILKGENPIDVYADIGDFITRCRRQILRLINEPKKTFPSMKWVNETDAVVSTLRSDLERLPLPDPRTRDLCRECLMLLDRLRRCLDVVGRLHVARAMLGALDAALVVPDQEEFILMLQDTTRPLAPLLDAMAAADRPRPGLFRGLWRFCRAVRGRMESRRR